jgi:leucyl aminopeptidase
MNLRALAERLPAGDWRIAGDTPWPAADVALAFALGGYGFDRYKQVKSRPGPRLVAGQVTEPALRIAEACALARNLINTPASDMGPAELETAARALAAAHGAELSVVVGDDLLAAGYPAVHAVGRAAVAARAPRMIEIQWGDPADPVVALVGKGVSFDTGGLDLKPSAGMRWMKKDMGGAAHALALGQLIMGAALPVCLVILVAAVENAVSGDAMRPGDVLHTRKGLTIEIGNTDAEGRLILADALTRAGELNPTLTLDFATLTGAARAALGPDVPPFFTDDDALAADLAAAALATEDPIWRLPLWDAYDESLDSDIADLKNDPDGWAQAGSITAALFLRRFAPAGSWAHFDIFAWRSRKLPGRAFGGEAQALRATYEMIRKRYGVPA